MRTGPITSPTIPLEPLTTQAFAPFGEVIAHAADGRRHVFPQVLEHLPEAGEPSFWVSRVEAAAVLPFAVTMLERHPYTAQTFLPLLGQRYLVVVTGAAGLGEPDLTGVRAFRAEAHQGVTYRRNVWHAGLTILEGPAEFAVLMHRTGRGDDDVFLDLPQPFCVVPTASGAA